MLNFGSLMLQKLLGKKSLSPEKRAELNTHKVELSAVQLKRLMSERWKPDIYDIMRALASGRFKRNGYRAGFRYNHQDSPSRIARRNRQIEKGIIQETPERVYKSSKTPEWLEKNKHHYNQQEVSNAGSR